MRNALTAFFDFRDAAQVSRSEWLLSVETTAAGLAYVVTLNQGFAHQAALAATATLAIATVTKWVRRSRERLGDVLPTLYREMQAAQSGRAAMTVSEGSFRTLCRAALARAPYYSRHVGVAHMRWAAAPALSHAALGDLRRKLSEAGLGLTLCFPNDQQVLVLVDGVRGLDEVAEAGRRLARAAAEAGVAVTAGGLAISPMHGYEADDLIDFARSGQATPRFRAFAGEGAPAALSAVG